VTRKENLNRIRHDYFMLSFSGECIVEVTFIFTINVHYGSTGVHDQVNHICTLLLYQLSWRQMLNDNVQ